MCPIFIIFILNHKSRRPALPIHLHIYYRDSTLADSESSSAIGLPYSNKVQSPVPSRVVSTHLLLHHKQETAIFPDLQTQVSSTTAARDLHIHSPANKFTIRNNHKIENKHIEKQLCIGLQALQDSPTSILQHQHHQLHRIIIKPPITPPLTSFFRRTILNCRLQGKIKVVLDLLKMLFISFRSYYSFVPSFCGSFLLLLIWSV